jgi:hypothetical protein
VTDQSSLCARQQTRFAERVCQKIIRQRQFTDLGMQRFDIDSGLGVFCGNVAAENPAAPSSNWARQAVIWFAWTSNCCASSASVFSPFKAANATFALNAGL